MFKALASLSSSSSTDVQVVSPPQQICATEARFCLPHPVTLTLKEKLFSFSGDDFKISCNATGTPYFQCQGRAWSLREKKVLRDTYGNPVANFKEKLLSFTDSFDIYAGENSDKKICKCSASYTFVKAKMYTFFQDAITGVQKAVVLKGDWRDKRCVIYLGEPKNGGVPIAKVFRPFSLKGHLFEKDSYVLEIAAGVDIALLVILCIAFDEHARD